MSVRNGLALAGLLCLGLLPGCASLSEKECRTADWQQIGYRDGSNGYPRSRAADHVQACRKSGVTVDEPRYFAGHAEGLQRYCTPDNGLRAGLSGQGYAGVCPADLAVAFEERYIAGREVWRQRQRIDEIDNERRNLEYQLGRAKTDDDRRYLRNSLRSLDFEARRERDILYMLERRLRVPVGGF
ncbi:DUF2799 domain-containing protein [Uliginosibacterium sp. H1]|uniref:DUF2799 domain-containing protein n=1 Tax=Uliginosibacterium sp. H1 TaxID=3114757 RepID=UPI002E19DCB9|nr:DUF2799 domain-containing protein [Uliginosibacterium sp. H1]